MMSFIASFLLSTLGSQAFASVPYPTYSCAIHEKNIWEFEMTYVVQFDDEIVIQTKLVGPYTIELQSGLPLAMITVLDQTGKKVTHHWVQSGEDIKVAIGTELSIACETL